MSNFIEKCITGEVLLDDIDDYVDQWHDDHTKVQIHEYLGMKKSEYSLWLTDPNILPFIVCAHRENRGVDQVVKEFYALPLAARTAGPQKANELIEWLKNEGLWE